MKRYLVALALSLSVIATAVWASGPTTLNVTPGTGAIMKEIADGSGNLGPTVALCDGAALANCATIKAASTPGATTDTTLSVTTADGNDVTLGAKADSVCGTATGTCSLQALTKFVANAVSSAIPAGTNIVGKVGIDQTTPGTTNAVVISPGCAGQSDANTTTTPINITANAKIITGVSAQKVRICQINLVVSAADNVALVEGTTTTTVCDTSTTGMAGGATAATGWNLAANGGLVVGNGLSTVFKAATNADNVCLFVSSGAQVSGNVVWVSF